MPEVVTFSSILGGGIVDLPKKYQKVRIFFGVLFLVSIAVYYLMSSMAWGEAPPDMGSNASLDVIATLITSFASCVTAIIAILGFVFTTAIGWRKEHRDVEKAMLEKEKLELEIEKQRRELNIDN